MIKKIDKLTKNQMKNKATLRNIEEKQAEVIVENRIKKPDMYQVYLLNDDYTPMEFVVSVLKIFFDKNQSEARQIMLRIHNHGVGVCGIYTYEIAETKANNVKNYALQNEHPLKCNIRKS